MNIYYIAAAAVAFGSAALHVFAGGAEIHAPIQASNLALPLRSISAVLWHAVTLTLLTGGIVAALLARRPNTAASIGIGLYSLGYVPIFMFYAVSLQSSVWALPQWVLFLAYAGLIFAGTRRTT